MKPELPGVPHIEIRRTDFRPCTSEPHDVLSPTATLSLLRDILAGREQESFIVLMLDVRRRVFAWREVARGTSTAVMFSPRDVFRIALVAGAEHVLIAHNHPSGDPDPSPQDLRLTAMMQEAGALLNVPVIDHIIIGAGESYYSFAARGNMSTAHAPISTGHRQGPELD